MENSFGQLLESANSILILLPTKPYFDQVAAALSLYLSLKETKPVTISCPAPMIVEFNRLLGVNKITEELGSKNLTIKFVGYKAGNIEKVSYDVENEEFKLTMFPKVGFESPKKEQVEVSYSGVGADLVILVGGGNISHFPALQNPDLEAAKVVHIGIRALLTDGQDLSIISFARPASSTSELTSILIAEGGLILDADVATNLAMGVEEGSNNFTGPDVTADTFQVFANLLRAGGQRMPAKKYESFPPGSIPGEEIPVPQKTAPKDWLEPKIFKGTTVS